MNTGEICLLIIEIVIVIIEIVTWTVSIMWRNHKKKTAQHRNESDDVTRNEKQSLGRQNRFYDMLDFICEYTNEIMLSCVVGTCLVILVFVIILII